MVFLGISFDVRPPTVSTPKERGVTSRRRTSLTSPVSTPPCIAAPTATHSSGFIPLFGALPKNSLMKFCTAGILVDPPTSSTWSISLGFSPESFIALFVGPFVASSRSSVNDSNFALVNVKSICFGPSSSAAIYGRCMLVSNLPDSSIFDFSAVSFNLCIATLSSLMFISVSSSNFSIIQSIILASKSSPPRRLLPDVALTSKTPSPISRMDTSNVPPPRSNTRMVCSISCLSIPYASAAAVGSFIILNTSKPAILPASLVACLCGSSKYAGTVITDFLISSPRYSSASFFSLLSNIADIS